LGYMGDGYFGFGGDGEGEDGFGVQREGSCLLGEMVKMRLNVEVCGGRSCSTLGMEKEFFSVKSEK